MNTCYKTKNLRLHVFYYYFTYEEQKQAIFDNK